MKIDVVVKGKTVAQKSVSTLADAFAKAQSLPMPEKGPISVPKITVNGVRVPFKPIKDGRKAVR